MRFSASRRLVMREVYPRARTSGRTPELELGLEGDDALADVAGGLARERAAVLVQYFPIQRLRQLPRGRQHVRIGCDAAARSRQHHEQGEPGQFRRIERI